MTVARFLRSVTARPKLLPQAMAAVDQAIVPEPPATVQAELRAMEVIYSELMDLDATARLRVLTWVAECYNMTEAS